MQIPESNPEPLQDAKQQKQYTAPTSTPHNIVLELFKPMPQESMYRFYGATYDADAGIAASPAAAADEPNLQDVVAANDGLGLEICKGGEVRAKGYVVARDVRGRVL